MDKKIINSIIEDFDYYTLWKYREKDINIVDCLSYFIENSINLCKSNYWDKNIKYDLEIKIIYDSKRNSYLIVDNSGGFNRDNLIKIMSTKLNHSSELYDYAQNIKRGIFWLGKDASIFVKLSNDNEICGSYKGKNKIENDLVNIEISELLSNNYLLNYGVAIQISDCYIYDRNINENNLGEIIKALGRKFSYYLSDDNKLGDFKIIINNNSSISENIDLEIINNKFENDFTSIFKFDSLKKRFKDNEIINLIDENLSKFKNEKSLNDFKFKILNNQRLIFDDQIIINDFTLPTKIYILKKPNINLAGAAITYKNIFVYYLNNLNKNDNGLYIPFNDRIKFGSWRWIRVEINIDNLKNYVKLSEEKNKLVFSLNSNINKDILDREITKLFKKWCEYACFIKKITKN